MDKLTEARNRFREGMSGKDWDLLFADLKAAVPKSKLHRKPVDPPKYPRGIKCGVFQDSYAQMINDILSNVRTDGVDYCYNLDVVIELLTYEPKIQCRYDGANRYFTVYM